MTTTDRGAHTPGQPSDEPPELCARLTTTREGTTECTIFPKDVSDAERTTTWITAADGSYVDVKELG